MIRDVVDILGSEGLPYISVIMATTKKQQGKVTGKAAPHTAAGQLLGYSTQQIRLTMMLKQAEPGSACGLEVLDDVSEERADGTTALVQSKSSLGHNPISNHAIPLWKSLCNWAELCEKKHIDIETTTLELYVTAQFSGSIAESFNSANDNASAIAAIADARRIMWGISPDYELKNKLAKDLAPFVNAALERAESVLIPLIRRMRLVCDTGSPHQTLLAMFANDPISPSKIEDFVHKMTGWVKTQVDELMAKGQPAIVRRDEFLKVYTAFARKYDRESILNAYSKKPTEEQTMARLPDPFVLQLGLIELTFEEQLHAVSDFLRAADERVAWSTEGDVLKESFDELDETLQRTWTNQKRTTDISHSDKTEVERGQLLFGICSTHTAMVQQMTPPAFFVPGCFHRLANELEIGWHPDYKARLASVKKP